MNRVIRILAGAVLALGSATAWAQDESALHRDGGLGFHDLEAPVGVRWWFADQKFALDLGVGYRSEDSDIFPDESVSSWAVGVGVPIVLTSWRRVHVLLRPGLLYQSQEVETSSPPDPFETDDETTLSITGEIEAEVFLMDNFSVSASHGIGWRKFDPVAGDDQSGFGTLGNNFSHVGFHVYLWGGEER